MFDPTCDPKDITRTLADAGCPEEFIQKYLRAVESGCGQEQRRLLECQRCRLLEGVHAEQRKLECLDYLRYQLKRQEKEH